MKYRLFAFLIMVLAGHAIFGQNTTKIIIGEQLVINSKNLSEERTCLISLPDSYYDASESVKKYPIIILLDGSTHFKTAAGIIDFMSSKRTRNNLMSESIIIAIENVDRERDFTVTKIKTKRPNTMGGGRNFLNFIEQELIPFVDGNYRTEDYRTLVGHSLGGLLTLNSYLDKHSIFDAYIAIDPSIWWDSEMMNSKVESMSAISMTKKLYIASANLGEAKVARNKQRHKDLYNLLIEKSGDSLNIEHKYYPDEDHRSVPLIALYEGFRFVNVKK